MRERVAWLALGSLMLAAWMAQHLYLGIWHDAQLYTLQALARVHPAELGGDLFLRFGSQDRFTLFSPIYACAIEWLGIGAAPALITLLCQAGFCAAFALLARRVLPTRLVWIAVALIMLVPLTYGARKVFYVVEDFTTPRLAAEALVLGALAAALGRRFVTAVVLLVLAALLHPIMAAGGFLVLLFLEEISARVRLMALAGLGAAAIGIFAMLGRSGVGLTFDPEWWALVHEGLPYLLPLEWRTVDWARIVVVASVLAAGFVTFDDARSRSLCRAALIAGASGVLATILGSDLLHLVFVSEIQPWRVLWLSTALAALFAPAVARELWNRGDLARAAAITLLSAFLLADERYALTVSVVAALLLAAALRQGPPPRLARAGFIGAVALAVLAVTVNLLSGSLVARALVDTAVLPGWMVTLRTVITTGLVPMTVIVGASLLCAERRPTAILAVFAAGGVAAVLALAPATFDIWRQTVYMPAVQRAFAPWRAIIPPRTEVLWFDSPLASWILLERPSFVSNVQAASTVFSREAALTARQRLQMLGPFLDSERTVAWRAPVPESQRRSVTLAQLCAGAPVAYVVTRKEMSASAVATLPDDIAAQFRGQKLYACPAAGHPRAGS